MKNIKHWYINVWAPRSLVMLLGMVMGLFVLTAVLFGIYVLITPRDFWGDNFFGPVFILIGIVMPLSLIVAYVWRGILHRFHKI